VLNGECQRAALALAVLVVLLSVLAVRAASAYGQSDPGQRPVQDAQTLSEVALAVGYWNAHGVAGCPDGISAFYADDLSGADLPNNGAAGRGGNCAFWLNAPYLRGSAAILAESNGVMPC
jgi:hypothetical protein